MHNLSTQKCTIVHPCTFKSPNLIRFSCLHFNRNLSSASNNKPSPKSTMRKERNVCTISQCLYCILFGMNATGSFDEMWYTLHNNTYKQKYGRDKIIFFFLVDHPITQEDSRLEINASKKHNTVGGHFIFKEPVVWSFLQKSYLFLVDGNKTIFLLSNLPHTTLGFKREMTLF